MSVHLSNVILLEVNYISNLLLQANLTDNKIVDTPIEINVHHISHDGELFCNFTLYQHMVHNFVYFIVTRPDISYAIHQVC